ncbi:MAG: D-alanyl-D-alanine carboxypeptidase family protein [Solirubrobacteraceae bacterium]
MRRRIAARLLATAACGAGACLVIPGSAAAAPRLSVTAAALYAPATGQLLFGVNPHRRLAIASTTKLMTALVTLERIHRLSTVFAQNDWEPAADDSQLGLDPGDRMSVHDLLIAMLLPSADDAAEDLAYNVGGGSVAAFVAMMNAQARALDLRDTHYSTPIGLDTPGNWSSAYDLDRLAAYDLGHSPYFARVVAMPHAVVRVDGVPRTVVNLNDLVARYPWIDGVKTGHTNDAGYVLVASARRDGLPLISAVLGTSSESARDDNTLALLDWGYAHFRTWTPIREGEALARPRIAGVTGMRARVVAAAGFTRVLPRSSRVRVVVHAPATLRGPLAARATVGSALVLDGGRVLARVPLVLAVSVPAAAGPTMMARLMSGSLVALPALGAVLIGLWAVPRARRRRVSREGS